MSTSADFQTDPTECQLKSFDDTCLPCRPPVGLDGDEGCSIEIGIDADFAVRYCPCQSRSLTSGCSLTNVPLLLFEVRPP